MKSEKDEKLEQEGVEPDDVEAPERPKRRRRRKKDDGEHAEAAETAKADGGEDAEGAEGAAPEAEEPAAGDDPDEPQEEEPARRRGSPEAAAVPHDTVPAPRDRAGRVAVRAQAKYVRCAPRKARLVVEHIRGKSVEDARAILTTTPRAAARDVLKLLDSAIANAENNHELVADELKIGKVFVDEGPTIKRFRPRAQGRATRINKRTSHMTIQLTTKEDI